MSEQQELFPDSGSKRKKGKKFKYKKYDSLERALIDIHKKHGNGVGITIQEHFPEQRKWYIQTGTEQYTVENKKPNNGGDTIMYEYHSKSEKEKSKFRKAAIGAIQDFIENNGFRNTQRLSGINSNTLNKVNKGVQTVKMVTIADIITRLSLQDRLTKKI